MPLNPPPSPQPERRASSPAAPPRRGGRWLFAIPLGIGITLIVIGQFAGVLSQWANESVASGLERAITQAIDPAVQPEDRRRVFVVDGQGHPASEQLQTFARDFESRYGRLASVSITSVTRENDDLDMSASVTLRTTEGEQLCAVRFRLVPSTPTEAALRGLEILDRARGDLAVGVRSPESLRSDPAESPVAR